jgi:hypothetical protein
VMILEDCISSSHYMPGCFISRLPAMREALTGAERDDVAIDEPLSIRAFIQTGRGAGCAMSTR